MSVCPSFGLQKIELCKDCGDALMKLGHVIDLGAWCPYLHAIMTPLATSISLQIEFKVGGKAVFKVRLLNICPDTYWKCFNKSIDSLLIDLEN